MQARTTLAEVVCSLSLATDLAMGEPLETGLAVCLRALALAEAAGVGDEERGHVFHVALLRHVGCTAVAADFAGAVGDERAFHHSVGPGDVTNPQAFFPFVVRHLVRTQGLFGAAASLSRMARQRERLNEGVLAICEVAELLAARLGLPAPVQESLLLGPERWDGKSFTKRRREENVPLPTRIVQVAECASIYDPLGGPDAATAVVGERAGKAFDPRLAGTFCAQAEAILATGRADSLWDAAIAAAPDTLALHGERLDTALEAMAEFVDLKSPYTLGHSVAVGRLAAAAAGDDDLRRSGLVHDLGRVGVGSDVWEKPGPLTADEWERVRLHPYLTERILARSPGLAELGATAGLHHERCDGSGYHRGVDGRALPFAARVLAAADAFQAMTEARPHRPALAPERAADELRTQSRAGRLDADAVEAVIAAAGGRPRRRRDQVAGLTARELDVLRLLARGLPTKQIAAELVVTPKTVDSHIQHIYAKIGVSTRAAASVFAMRHGLVDANFG